jgi:hypothetical protein
MENNLCIIGNSHISQFDSNLNNIYGWGASIFGLYNENSFLKLKEQILSYQASNPGKILVFFLGQTDIEFIYYYKCVLQKKKLDIYLYIDSLIKHYIDFVNNFITNDFIMMGINPHVIDNIKHVYNVNFRNNIPHDPNGTLSLNISFEECADIYNYNYHERFDFNMYFNKKLKKECENNNIKYCDINKYILDENNKVKSEFFPSETDHHLKKIKTYIFIL